MHHYHYAHYINLFKNKELRDMYLALSLKSFALSMIGIFIPIFLIREVGLTLNKVVLFYVIETLAFLLFAPIAGKIASKFGLRKASIASIPLFIVSHYALYNIHTFTVSIHWLAALFGITQSLFGIPFSVHFLHSSDKKHRSEEVGLLFSSSIAAAVAGPFIGGLLVTLYGFNILFTIVIIFFFLSIPPMMLTKDYHVEKSFNPKRLLTVARRKSTLWIAEGSNIMTSNIFWPIFLISVLGVYAETGLVFTLSSLAAVFAAIYAGSEASGRHAEAISKVGSSALSVSWIFRALLNNPFTLSVFTVVGHFAHMLVIVPFQTQQLNANARRKHLIEYFIFREFMISIGKLLVLSIILVSNMYKPAFFANALLTLMHLIV